MTVFTGICTGTIVILYIFSIRALLFCYNISTVFLIQIQLYRSAGHRRGDHAHQAQQLGGYDEGCDQNITEGQE